MKITTIKKPGITLNLDMTDEEATVLLSIMAAVGGSPYGPREVVHGIYNALISGGYHGVVWPNKGSVFLPDSWNKFKKKV